MVNVALAGLVEVVRHIPAVRAEFIQCLTDCLLRPGAPNPVEGAIDEALCVRFCCEHEREEEPGRGEAESMPESEREHEPGEQKEEHEAEPNEPAPPSRPLGDPGCGAPVDVG